MKKRKKIIIIIISLLVILSGLAWGYYTFFYNPNDLNLTEKKWINDNENNVITFNIPNDINIFGNSGSGVFYDFLDDFNKQYDLTLNKNATTGGTVSSGLAFNVSKTITNSDLLLYEDHYVVVGKNLDTVTSFNDLKGSAIGGLAEDVSRVSSIYDTSVTYTTYDSKDALITALQDDSVKYIVVPENEYIDIVLNKGYKIVYHLSDIKKYYYLTLGTDETLNSIVTKFYNEWVSNELETSYYAYTYNLFVDELGLTQVETDSLTNKTYTYGFVNMTPYQTLSGSKYGGIIMAYLDDFSKFSNVDFTYTKYSNPTELVKAYNNSKIDLMFNDTNLTVDDYEIDTNFNNKYYIVSPLDTKLTLADISELTNKKVYVLKTSSLYTYLSSITGLNIESVDTEKELISAANKGNIVAISSYTYDYLVNSKIKNTYISYTGYTTTNYSYRYGSNSDAFYQLFSAYVNYLDSNNMVISGLISYQSAATNGSFISTVAKYVLVIISIGVVLTGIIIVSRRHLKLDTKIRKDEKLKFVDMLTSLKNRNYLNEKMQVWNQNTIYPQAIIVIDLNNIKYLNDTYGHEEGDNQIAHAANILIKTQPDNSEIMRTDGNEFTLYLVGYTEKQVINYMKKLIKEFNNLPYEYGAAFGFSMIVDDLKLIDDAINEATIQMRNNKMNSEGTNNEKAE